MLVKLYCNYYYVKLNKINIDNLVEEQDHLQKLPVLGLEKTGSKKSVDETFYGPKVYFTESRCTV